MSEINPTGPAGAYGAAKTEATGKVASLGRNGRVAAASLTRHSDRVELSQHARLLSRLSELPDIRTDLVNRIRQELAEGRYDTDAKLDTAIDNLVAEDL